MSKPRIADLDRIAENYVDQWRLDESDTAMVESALPALLRLARAAKEFRRLPTVSSAEEIDYALDAFDWGEE